MAAVKVPGEKVTCKRCFVKKVFGVKPWAAFSDLLTGPCVTYTCLLRARLGCGMDYEQVQLESGEDGCLAVLQKKREMCTEAEC